MHPFVLLTILSVLAVFALFVVLGIHLIVLVRILSEAGGTATSLLAKIRMGVRAIEVQTGGLAPRVTRLNNCLSEIRNGLTDIDTNLTGVVEAVSRQEAR